MYYKLAVALGLVLLAVGCSFENKKEDTNLIDAEEFVAIIEQDTKAREVTLIDLRTPGEVNDTGVISGAQVIDYINADFDSSMKVLDKSKSYIVYCKAGGRSAKAAKRMKKMGLNVRDYSGGMNDWLVKKNQTVQLSL